MSLFSLLLLVMIASFFWISFCDDIKAYVLQLKECTSFSFCLLFKGAQGLRGITGVAGEKGEKVR